MSQALMSQALRSSKISRTNTSAVLVSDWIAHFTQAAAVRGYALDIQALTELPEWQALLNRVLKIEEAAPKSTKGEELNPKTDFRWKEETSFALYRILGNDLPPRHYRGQTVDNLRFILQYEPPLHNCQKKWIVNKIVDLAQEKAILKLLDETHQSYTYLPFDEAAYARVPFDFESFLEPDFLRSETFRQLDTNSSMWAADRPYRLKRLHLVSLNKLRNQALSEGKKLAEWTLVLDGSCFLMGDAWGQILQAASGAEPSTADKQLTCKYLIVPMVRLMHNEQLFLPDSIPSPEEEPHIAIHRDAQETYDEDLHYGRFNKVEFLRRIQVPGVWDSWSYKPWERKQWRISDEAHQWKKAGWVVRLSSGHVLDGDQTIAGMTARTFARQEAVWDFIDGLDEKVFRSRFYSQRLLFFNQVTLERYRCGWLENEPCAVSVVQSLIQAIDQESTQETGTDSLVLERSQWAFFNRGSQFQMVMVQVTSLVLLAYFTGRVEYAKCAVTLVREQFLAVAASGVANGVLITHALSVHCFLDALRLLDHLADEWVEVDYSSIHQSMQTWCQNYLTWLLQSDEGQADRCSHDHRATCYDLQIAALASYCDDARTLLKTLEYIKLRIDSQFDADGAQLYEFEHSELEHSERGYSTPLHGCMVNLQAWAALLLIGETLSIDIADYTTQNGRSLEQAFRWLLSYYERPFLDQSTELLEVERPLALFYVAFECYPSLKELFFEKTLLSRGGTLTSSISDFEISSFWIFALSDRSKGQ